MRGPVTYTATLFQSRIRNPVTVDVTDAYVMTNLPEPTTNMGAELLATFVAGSSRAQPPIRTSVRASLTTANIWTCRCPPGTASG